MVQRDEPVEKNHHSHQDHHDARDNLNLPQMWGKPFPPPPYMGSTKGGATVPTGTPARGAGAGEGKSVRLRKTPASSSIPARTTIVMVRRRLPLLVRGGFVGRVAALCFSGREVVVSGCSFACGEESSIIACAPRVLSRPLEPIPVDVGIGMDPRAVVRQRN